MKTNINPVLLAYNHDLKECYVFEIEKTKEYAPDYMGSEEWCFTVTNPDNGHDFDGLGCVGSWDKLSLLMFVEDNDIKQEKLFNYLQKTEKTILYIDDIVDVLTK